MTSPFSDPSLVDRIQQIRQTLPASVRLIAVTKQVPTDMMRVAYAVGIRDFGESRIQEAETKRQALQDLSDVTWHLIGHLQTNKAQKALRLFDWIHSVDSLKLATHLNHLAETNGCRPQACLQVKLRPDPNKQGWTESELLENLDTLDRYSFLQIRGLMTIPPANLDAPETLAVFQDLHRLAETIRQRSLTHIQMHELSMGMSGDYPLAIQAGATMVRLGRIMFGDRPV